MGSVQIEKLNEVYIRVKAEPSIMMELGDKFTFWVEGYRFTPAYKRGHWDGKIRLLNQMTGMVYTGLFKEIYKYCKHYDYQMDIDPNLLKIGNYPDDIGYSLAKEFKAPYEPRDFQNNAVAAALNQQRALILSPTASGKSFIIYLIARYHVDHHKRRVLIIVPTTSLVEQMRSDFIEYNNGKDMDIHTIRAGKEKHTTCDYTITTWQSMMRMPRDYYDQFDVVIGDEAHLYGSKQLTKIMESMGEVKYRYGFTGTLKDAKCNELVLTGLFGPVFVAAKLERLIKEKILAEFKIKSMVLSYPEEDRKNLSKMKYREEVDWLVANQVRNNFIKNLALNLEGNTLILFSYVENHGKVLEKLLRVSDKHDIHFLDGSTKVEIREGVRDTVEKSGNNIILASYKLFSTGVNIKRLDNIIFAFPLKSKIPNLQSIGRGLRRGNGKTSATLYDLGDDLRWKTHTNYTWKHFEDRCAIYDKEKLNYKIYQIPLKSKKENTNGKLPI